MCKCMTFPRYLTAWFQAAECSDFVFIQEKLCPCASPIWIVYVCHGGEDSAHPPMRTSRSMVNDLQCSQGEQWQEAYCPQVGPFSEMETHPGRTEMPNMREVAPDTPKGFKQICSFVNSVHRVSNKENVPKCQGHVTTLSAKGIWHFLSARGMDFHLKLWDDIIGVGPHHVRSG